MKSWVGRDFQDHIVPTPNEKKFEITTSRSLGVISELASTIVIMQRVLKWT